MESWEEEASASGLASAVEAMREAWRKEKAAPEMLEFEGAAVRRLREQMELQEERAEEMRGAGADDVVLSLLHMDADRARFLLKAYLRLRLAKVVSLDLI